MRKGQGKLQIKARLDEVNAELERIGEAWTENWDGVQLMSATGRLFPVPEAAIRVILAVIRDAYEREQRMLQKAVEAAEGVTKDEQGSLAGEVQA